MYGRKTLKNAIKCYLRGENRKEYLTAVVTTNNAAEVYETARTDQSEKKDSLVRKSTSVVVPSDGKKRSPGDSKNPIRPSRCMGGKGSTGKTGGKGRRLQNQSATEIPLKLRLKSTGSVEESQIKVTPVLKAKGGATKSPDY